MKLPPFLTNSGFSLPRCRVFVKHFRKRSSTEVLRHAEKWKSSDFTPFFHRPARGSRGYSRFIHSLMHTFHSLFHRYLQTNFLSNFVNPPFMTKVLHFSRAFHRNLQKWMNLYAPNSIQSQLENENAGANLRSCILHIHSFSPRMDLVA